MGSVSLPTIALIASVGSAAGSAYMQHEQGVAVKNEDAAKARQETLKAQQNQINMRQKMLASLASQNAGTLGAVGTGRGTGFGANAMRQITQNQNDLLVSQANESAQVSLLDQQGANAEASGNIGGAATLVGGVGTGLTNYARATAPQGS